MANGDKRLEPEQEAYIALRTAYLEYTRWQPDGDWDTFLSYAADERGPIRPELDGEYTKRNWPPLDRVVGLAHRFVCALGGAKMRKSDLDALDPLMQSINDLPMQVLGRCLDACTPVSPNRKVEK